MTDVADVPRESKSILSPARSAGAVLVHVVPIAGAVVASLVLLQPPPPAGTDAPPTSFSAARARQHLARIAEAPHAVGSPAHRAVETYLVRQFEALGLTTGVLPAAVASAGGGSPQRITRVRNVLARLGPPQPQAVLLVAHYDSVPTSFGASDAGTAVATLLETARALAAGPPLPKPVLFLCTDAEETGLSGARAFVQEHLRGSQVGVVVNLDARGSEGPVLMFETSPGNGDLIAALASAVPRPVASSAFYDVYTRMPNSTDFGVFKRAGVPGLNLAHIGNASRYHSALDNLEGVDMSTLQHQGSYALGLATYFAGAGAPVRSGNAVYFNAGPWLVHYSEAWARPLALLLGAIWIAVVAFAMRRRRLTAAGVLLGGLAIVVCAVVSALLVVGAYELLRRVDATMPYDRAYYAAAFCSLTVCAVSATFVAFRRRRVADLLAGALLCWLIALAAASVLAPGWTYVFTWPVAFALVALGTMVSRRSAGLHELSVPTLASLVAAVVAVFLIVPLVHLILIAVPLAAAALVMLLVVLLLGVMIPHVHSMATVRPWLVPGLSGAAGVALVAAALMASQVDRNRPLMDHLFYYLDADRDAAFWGSEDARADAWTGSFVAAGAQAGPWMAPLPSFRSQFRRAPAPVLTLLSPTATLVDSSATATGRTLRLRLASRRAAPVMFVTVSTDARLVRTAVDGKDLAPATSASSRDATPRWQLLYEGVPPEGLELLLQVDDARAPLTVRVVDQSYDLPAGPGLPGARPPHLIARPSPLSDTTLVSRSFTYDAGGAP